MNAVQAQDQIVYWHRDLPPLDAEAIGVHTIEATSTRLPDTFARRDELWDRCCAELMAQARIRLEQEVLRLGGDCARVLDEVIDVRRDAGTGEAWLHGRFDYVLYRRPRRPVEREWRSDNEGPAVVAGVCCDRGESRHSGL
jgi:hypothetical protein